MVNCFPSKRYFFSSTFSFSSNWDVVGIVTVEGGKDKLAGGGNGGESDDVESLSSVLFSVIFFNYLLKITIGK